MNRFGFEPDFDNFATVVTGGRGHRVPNVELVIDQEIKDGFMGRAVKGLADEIDFRYQAGYDYAWVTVGMVDPAGTVNKEHVAKDAGKHFEGEDERVWADEHEGLVKTLADVEAFPWPEPDALDWSPLVEAEALLKPGMKLIAVLGKIFTASWQLMGFETFCMAMYQQPELVDALVRRVAESQMAVFRKAVEFDTVGAVWVPDDVAYHSGPMVPPEWLQQNVFSWYKQMGNILREAGKPLLYHSDGDMSLLVDTMVDCGITAFHPVEPESMDIYELRRRVGKRLALMGNIRVHTLSTATPDVVRDLVRDRIENLGHDGAYCVGSSNSVPNYVPLENYLAMLETSAELAPIA